MLRPRVVVAAALVAAGIVLGFLLWPSHRAALRVWIAGTTIHVDTPASSRVYVEYGPTRAYGLFTAPSSGGQAHRFDLAGLDPNLRYHVRAVVRSGGRTQLGRDLTMSVPRGATSHSLHVAGDHFELDGRPWIPTFTWGSCASSYAAEAALGIRAFMSSNCGDTPQRQTQASLHVGGVLIPAVDQANRALPTTVATYYTDEPDLTRIPPAQLAGAWKAHPGAHGIPTFLTVSHLVLSAGGTYQALDAAYAHLADALGVDVYPISTTGDPRQIIEVAAAQQALRTLAAGKPTFQWIEVTRPLDDSGATPTPAQIEAEAWIAIVNGARALGWWTNGASPFSVSAAGRQAIHDVTTALDSFAPAIDAPTAPVTLDNAGVAVFATELDGATTVFAVNTDPTRAVPETFTVPGLARRPVSIWNTDRTPARGAATDTFTDTLPPLAWRVYLIPPG